MGVEDSKTGPRFQLRGSMRPLSSDLLVFGLLGFVVLLLVLASRSFFANSGPAGAVFGGLLGFGVFVAILYSLLTGRSLLLVYPTRVVLDTRPEGGGSRLVLDYAQLRSVGRDGCWIRLRVGDQIHSFRGARLHVEDAFDALADCLEHANPECMVLGRG